MQAPADQRPLLSVIVLPLDGALGLWDTPAPLRGSGVPVAPAHSPRPPLANTGALHNPDALRVEARPGGRLCFQLPAGAIEGG